MFSVYFENKKMPKESSSKRVAADSELVDAFWKIAEHDAKVRFEFIEIILNKLSLKNAARADDEPLPDLDYTLNRLISGLASTRKAARQGFSVALCEVLRSIPSIDPNHVISLIFKLIPLSNAVGERSAAAVGQILAFASLVRSGVLSSYSSCYAGVVEAVLQLAEEKPYIEHACCVLLEELFNNILPSDFTKFVWPVLESKLSIGWEKATPQILWMLSVCANLFPEVISKNFLSQFWKAEELYTNDTYAAFGKILKKSTSVHPLLHPLCIEVINQLVQLKHKKFRNCWRILFEESLLEAKQYNEAYLAFELIKLIMPKLKNPDQVMIVFSPKFCELFIRTMKMKYSPLHMAASQLCDFLVEFSAKCDDPDIQISILKVFIMPPSTLMFDQINNSSAVQVIVRELKVGAILQYTRILVDVLCQGKVENDTSVNDNLKCHSARQLSRLIGHPAAEETLKTQILQQLFLHGFFSVITETVAIPWCSSSVVLSDNVQETCRLSFLHALELLQMPPIRKGYHGRLDHQLQVLTPLVEYADLLLLSADFVKPVRDMGELFVSWKKMNSMLKKVVRYSEKDGKNEETSIFQIFYLQLGFWLFYELESSKKILGELNQCCKQSLRIRKNALKTGDEVEQKIDGPHWAEVVMDLIMSLLSDQSRFVRALVGSVFPALCPFMTSDCMKQLMDAINPANDEDPLGNEDEEVEFESGSSSDSDDEEVNGTAEDVDDEFRKKVKTALGHAADESDEDETYLSDSAMFKLDDAISEVFLQRSHSKKKKEKLKEEQTQNHFRLRCINLLAQYVKKDPKLSLIIVALEPLVITAKIGAKNQKLENLSAKACDVLKNIAKIRKFNDTSAVQQTDLQGLLNFLLSTLQKVSDSAFKNILLQLCSFAVSCSESVARTQNISSKDKKRLSEWFFKLCKGLLNSYFEMNTLNLNPQLFDSLFLSCGEHSTELLSFLEVAAFESKKRIFERTQALGFMILILQKAGTCVSADKTFLRDFGVNLLPKVLGTLREMTESGIKPVFASKLMELISVFLQISVSNSLEVFVECNHELSKVLESVSLKKLNARGKRAGRKIRAHLQNNGASRGNTNKKRHNEELGVISTKKTKTEV